MEISTVLYENFTELANRLLISKDKTVKFQNENSEFLMRKRDIKEILEFKLSTGVYSNYILEQLTIHRCQLGESMADNIEFYNASSLLELIESIENGKIEGKPFKHEPLKGLFKVHHSSLSGLGYSLVRNIIEYWFDESGSIKRKRQKDFESIIERYGSERVGVIAIEMHSQTLKFKKLKGEWLIYKIFKGKKYYLCFAAHEEGDNKIFEDKILECYAEFPELTKL